MGRTKFFQYLSRLLESSSGRKSRKVGEKQKEPGRVKRVMESRKVNESRSRRVRDSQVESCRVKDSQGESTIVKVILGMSKSQSQGESSRLRGANECHGESRVDKCSRKESRGFK